MRTNINAADDYIDPQRVTDLATRADALEVAASSTDVRLAQLVDQVGALRDQCDALAARLDATKPETEPEPVHRIGQPITREEILARSVLWPLAAADGTGEQVPYSRTDYRPDGDGHAYRQDCSGYVSMCLHADRPGRTPDRQGFNTRNLDTVSSLIAKNDLRPGDFLLARDRHCLVFIEWANEERTQYLAREATSAQGGTIERVVPYPYWTHQADYMPMRYHYVKEKP